MAKDNQFVNQIADIETDFPRWYTDVVVKTKLVDYGPVKGTMVIRPYGYAIWENIQKELDARIKATGHQNAYFPLLIPYSYMTREAEHVEGFAPEVAVVTVGGGETLAEPLVIRPTSETIFGEMYSKWLQSYRDLPILINQWANVMRWEKTTRPFLRTSEFLWQEGHTAHATAEEAEARTQQMLNLYADFCEEVLAIPVVRGQKTDKEKFAGAEATYTIEALMHDGKALQSGTSHNFGDGFAKAFGIQYAAKDNSLQYVHQTSWGMSTRIIGALIMVHGDDSGLVLPPRIAPVQIMIVPVQQKKEGVLDAAFGLRDRLIKAGFSVKVDDTDKSPGWKFADCEMRGIPLRVEIGPKDLEKNQAVLVRRDTHEKSFVSLDNLEEEIGKLLETIQSDMFARAKAHLEAHTSQAVTWDAFVDTINTKPGFVKAMWCGCQECEDKIKEETGATSRCMPFKQETLSDTCVCCGKPAKKMVYWGRAY